MSRHGRVGLAAIAALTNVLHAQSVLYVDGNSPINGPGGDWEHAHRYLQDALNAAGVGNEIRVAQGSYRPDESTANPDGTGDREATFQLPSGVIINGGFMGFGATDPDERDIALFETILSGDIGVVGNDADNSFHVVTGSGIDETTVLDGVTIAEGNADGSGPNESGGGMYINQGSPTITRCIFTENFASATGGGIVIDLGDPTVVDCTFVHNTVTHGGGAINLIGGHVTLIRCLFDRNFSDTYGGGLHSDNPVGAMFTITDCVFIRNAASAQGGGIFLLTDEETRITSCEFLRNFAGGDGGGVMAASTAELRVTNCRFTGNESLNGAGMTAFFRSDTDLEFSSCTFTGNRAGAIGGGVRLIGQTGLPRFTNCILWDNHNADGTGEAAQIDGDIVQVSHSCIQDNDPDDESVPFGGEVNGNIDDTPLFIDHDGIDGIVGTEDDDLRLLPGSPGIDMGNNTLVPSDLEDMDGDGDVSERIPFDLDDRRRFADDPDTADKGVADLPAYPHIVDMGAYEYRIAADLDGDGDVDADDFIRFAGCLAGPGVSTAPPECDFGDANGADLDRDNDVDLADFSLFTQDFSAAR